MLCDSCCAHMHRKISILEGKTVNMLCYGCDAKNCDSELRARLDEYTKKQIQKWRDEK